MKKHKKKITHEMIREGVYNHFKGYSVDWDFIDLAISTLERIEHSTDDAYEDVYNAIDEEVIYYSQQWLIMQNYQRPDGANLVEAISQFAEDLVDCIYEIMDANSPNKKED